MRSLARTTYNLADQIKDSTGAALANYGTNAMKMLRSARRHQTRAFDGLLGRLGLQRRQSAMRPVLYFAAGAVVVGGVALILSPTWGKKLRMQIAELVRVAKDTANEMARGGERDEMGRRVDAMLSDANVSISERERPRAVPSNHS